jgi:hypothetical protein
MGSKLLDKFARKWGASSPDQYTEIREIFRELYAKIETLEQSQIDQASEVAAIKKHLKLKP